MYSNIKYDREILDKRLKYKFFFFNLIDEPFLMNLSFNINVKDDLKIYLFYYYIQNIFFKKPNIKELSFKILSGGFKQNSIRLNILLKNKLFIYNLLKIIYVFIINKYIRKENIFINNNMFSFNILLNNLKKLNIRENLNIIKSILEININKKNLLNNYVYFYLFKLLGFF